MPYYQICVKRNDENGFQIEHSCINVFFLAFFFSIVTRAMLYFFAYDVKEIRDVILCVNNLNGFV